MIHFVLPYVFFLLPLPWVIWRWFPSSVKRSQAALKVPFFERFEQLEAVSKPSRWIHLMTYRQALSLLAWVCFILALAGPQWLSDPIPLPQKGRDLMLAIDLSGSMQTPDLLLNGQKTTRIAVVKQIAIPFIEQRVGDRIGMVVFGTKAYLQAPLTFDRETAKEMLEDATVGLAGPETAIGDAIGLAVKRLLTSPATSRAIILLTDGGNNSGTVTPLDAAKVAAENHIKIYTIGIGAPPDGSDPENDLDLETLKKIADVTQGQFFNAQNGEELRDIYQSINRLEPLATDQAVIREITPLYPWPLSLALAISFFLAVIRLKKGGIGYA